MCDKLSAPALTTAGESGEISRSNPLSLLPTLLFGLLVIGSPPPVLSPWLRARTTLLGEGETYWAAQAMDP